MSNASSGEEEADRAAPIIFVAGIGSAVAILAFVVSPLVRAAYHRRKATRLEKRSDKKKR